MDSVLDRHFGSDDLCDIAGISYRQLDYWVRLGLIETVGAAAPGSGGIRRYLRREARVVTVVARLRELGATEKTLRHVAPMLRAMTTEEWHGDLLVSADGEICPARASNTMTFGEACWIVSLDLVAHRSAA